MAANPTFQLESASPADRAARAAEKRRDMREANARSRAAARAAGEKQVTVSLHESLIVEIDALAKRAGLRNRSQVVARDPGAPGYQTGARVVTT
jgi:hypothetical protein